MNNNLFTKITSLIMKDTGGLNESPKLVGIIRYILFFLSVNNIINVLIYKNSVNTFELGIIIAFIVIFAVLLFLTYRLPSKNSFLLVNVATLVWIHISVTTFGWGTGIQHYIIILLILCFFYGQKHFSIKITYAFALVCYRLYLYFYCENNVITLSTLQANKIIQVPNTIIIFGMISIIMYIFSSDSQALENKLIEYNNQLKSQANTDALTGLNNRRKGREYMEKLLDSSSNAGFCVCICDIDFFKKVNDNYGHDVGDLVLLTLSSILRSELSDKAFVARWGGEEFLIVFPNMNGDEAMVTLESLRQRIKNTNISVADKSISITVTFGLAEYDYSGDIDSILKEADNKLYIGKESGRDRIVY